MLCKQPAQLETRGVSLVVSRAFPYADISFLLTGKEGTEQNSCFAKVMSEGYVLVSRICDSVISTAQVAVWLNKLKEFPMLSKIARGLTRCF